MFFATGDLHVRKLTARICAMLNFGRAMQEERTRKCKNTNRQDLFKRGPFDAALPTVPTSQTDVILRAWHVTKRGWDFTTVEHFQDLAVE